MRILALPALLLALAAWAGCRSEQTASPSEAVARPVEAPLVTVYKSPTCGCCGKWVEHLQANGFRVETRDTADVTPIKVEHGLPRQLASCHTGIVDGYVVEGHVPADVIHQLLQERPEVAGIAVPGMPIGSPGMEQGDRVEPYDVVAFRRDGSTSVYASRR